MCTCVWCVCNVPLGGFDVRVFVWCVHSSEHALGGICVITHAHQPHLCTNTHVHTDMYLAPPEHTVHSHEHHAHGEVPTTHVCTHATHKYMHATCMHPIPHTWALYKPQLLSCCPHMRHFTPPVLGERAGQAGCGRGGVWISIVHEPHLQPGDNQLCSRLQRSSRSHCGGSLSPILPGESSNILQELQSECQMPWGSWEWGSLACWSQVSTPTLIPTLTSTLTPTTTVTLTQL